MTERRLSTPAVGLIALLAILAINLGFFLNIFQNMFSGGGRTVRTVFRDAGQLYAGDSVRIDGRIVGKVTRVKLLNDGSGSEIDLQLPASSGPLYATATASLRFRTLLGGAFYVALDPGDPRTGPLGDRTIRRTSSQVEIDDITTIFSRRAKQGLQTLAPQLAQTFADPWVPGRLLSDLRAASPALNGGLRALRGQVPDTDLQRVIDRAAVVTRALETPDQDLRGLVAGAAATLRTTAQRDREIENILAQGPFVAQSIRTTLGGLDTTLTAADRLVVKLRRSADAVAPTLAALHPTLTTTARLAIRAMPLVRTLRPAVRSLADTSVVAIPLLDALQPSLDRLDKIILPYLGKQDPGTGYSTTVMIGGTAAGFGGAAASMDQNGHFIRFPATLGTKSVHLPCTSSIVDPAAPSALACEDLQTALQGYLGFLPLASSPGHTGAKR